jgi:hypothetical protein
MHGTVSWIVHCPVDMNLFLCIQIASAVFIAMGFHCQSSNVMKTNVIKWCKWPQWIIAVYGRGWNCVPFVVLYCVMQWPEQGIWKPGQPSVCPVGQNEGELWGVIRPDMWGWITNNVLFRELGGGRRGGVEGLQLLVGHSCSESHITNLSGILVASECILPPAGLREGRVVVLFAVCAWEPASFVSCGNPSQ